MNKSAERVAEYQEARLLLESAWRVHATLNNAKTRRRYEMARVRWQDAKRAIEAGRIQVGVTA